MKNILKKSLILALGCFMAKNISASTDFSKLNYNGENSIPSGYTLSTTNPPQLGQAKAGLSEGGYYINISNGGAASLTNNIPNKRFMSFVIDEDCSVNIHFYSSSTNRELHICTDDGRGSVASNKVTTKDVDHELSYTFSNITKSTTCYFYGQSNSNLYLTKITFTAAAPPTPVSSVSVAPTTLTLEEGEEGTLTATVLPNDASNKAITWSSSAEGVATVDQNGKVTAIAEGTATITVTSQADNTKKATCAVTVKKATTVRPVESISLSPSTLTLTEGGSSQLTVTFTPTNATNKGLTWASSNTRVATVSNGLVSAIAAGTTTITATSDDGGKTATCAVTVKEATPVPATNLTIHEPEVYEDSKGYHTPLAIFDNREYEVYYMTRDGDSKFIIATTNADKTAGITNIGTNEYSCTAKDGWFRFSGTGWSSASDAVGNEFSTMSRRLDMDNTCEFSMHISGFDQFAIVARDKKKDTSSAQNKPDDNRFLEIYVDDVLRTEDYFNTNPTIRRYDITPKEHVIRVVHKGSEKSAMYAFSLRVSQSPRVRHLQGNDSTQNVLVAQSIKDITYRVKYNEETRLVWEGAEATGITLTKGGTAGVADSMIVSGAPICDAGDYTYRVVTYQNGAEASSVKGKLHVSTKLETLTELQGEGYVGEDIDEFQFRFYAKDVSSVSVAWKDNNAPAGISTYSNGNIFIIGGVPTTTGNYEFTVSVAGGNSFDGTLTINSSELGSNPALYFYKTSNYENDIVYKTIKAKGFTPAPRKAKKSGMRALDQLNKFDLIVISEDVDADNEEVLDIIRNTEVTVPVLNLKSFTYSTSRLGWGYPNNGYNRNTKITVMQPTHPIFKGLYAIQNGALDILNLPADSLTHGIMPSDIYQPHNTVCLAIAPKNGIEYMTEGDLAVAIHEIPVDQRSGKYILFPVGNEASLNNNGTRLLQNIVDYLTDASVSGVALPELKISSLVVNGAAATIDEDAATITLTLPSGTDLSALRPDITLADQSTLVTPASGEAQDFSKALYGLTYTVSDYINRRAYQVIISAEGTGWEDNEYQGIYFDGLTLHNPNGVALYVLDVTGRIVAYSNSDVDMSAYNNGLYLISTRNFTLKIMR